MTRPSTAKRTITLTHSFLTAHPPLHLHNNPTTLRRRTRPPPPRPGPARRSPEIHRPQDSAQRPHQRQINRRRRRRGRTRRERHPDVEDPRDGRQADRGDQESQDSRRRGFGSRAWRSSSSREEGSEVQGLMGLQISEEPFFFSCRCHSWTFRLFFSFFLSCFHLFSCPPSVADSIPFAFCW